MAKETRTRREQKRICNLVPSRDTEKDWRLPDALAAGALAAPRALPASVDLREPWWTVGDQEDTGSCVGWASTDGVARYMFVKAGRLTPKDRLSPRFTWMASKETDQFTARPETMIEAAGTSLKAAVDILRKFGAVPEAMLPFHVKTAMYRGDPNAFYATAAGRKIASYFNLQRNLADWRAWLAAHGPILAGLNVDRTWDDAAMSTGNLDRFQPDTARGGHAVAVVGYRADGRFILRNSWGTAWGDKGYGYATEAYMKDAFFAESYGVAI